MHARMGSSPIIRTRKICSGQSGRPERRTDGRNGPESERKKKGDGGMKIEKLLDERQMNGKVGLFAKVTIPPRDVLEFHEHHGETETYYILSGEGIYDDDGREVLAKAGDVFFCEEGHGHGIRCSGEEDLVFMALIILN